MLKNVSWSAYLIGLVAAVIIYYVIVGLKYYRKQISSFLEGKLPKKADSTNGPRQNLTNVPIASDATLEELETVVNDLRYAVLDKAGKEAGKEKLLEQFKERLAKYDGLRKPAFRVAINNYIIIQAEELCGVVFSDSELNEAWDSLPR